jgi:hypothetical protein
MDLMPRERYRKSRYLLGAGVMTINQADGWCSSTTCLGHE